MQAIQDYFLIGDLRTAALVSSDGSIDWLCLPYFDSPSVFARILDERRGGSFSVSAEGYTAVCRYVPETAIVETIFAGQASKFAARDFMVPASSSEAKRSYIVRKIIGISGDTVARFLLDIKPDYARAAARVSGDRCLLEVVVPQCVLRIHLPEGARLAVEGDSTCLEISVPLKEGEEKQITLEAMADCESESADISGRDFESETRRFWRDWLSQGVFFDYCRDLVVRSAITLKLMQFIPTGALIAAPTTSLPEAVGGVRNWDYRYTWVRDAAFTVYALSLLGFTDEAVRFFTFMEQLGERSIVRRHGEERLDLSVLYTIWGSPLDGESELTNLSGYRDSQPVRIGNGAAHQLQLDIYGSLIDAYYCLHTKGVPLTERGKRLLRLLIQAIERDWLKPDEGIWEVRGGSQHFTYSKAMCWVGIERALRLRHELEMDDYQTSSLRQLQYEIETWIWRHCYDASTRTLRQFPGADGNEATNFLLVLLGFVASGSEHGKHIIDATRAELVQDHIYVDRYHTDDGLAGKEGSFLLCTFWQIAALAATGQTKQAELLMSSVKKLIPASGLLSEEIDRESGDFLGNHPQAYSHIGLILSAHMIDRQRSLAAQPEQVSQDHMALDGAVVPFVSPLEISQP